MIETLLRKNSPSFTHHALDFAEALRAFAIKRSSNPINKYPIPKQPNIKKGAHVVLLARLGEIKKGNALKPQNENARIPKVMLTRPMYFAI